MKKKHSFFADTKQQVDQIKRKIVVSFKKPILFNKQTFLKVKTTITFRVKKQDKLTWKCLGSQLNLSAVRFNLSCSLL